MDLRAPRYSLSSWLTGAVVATALTAVACTLLLVESFAHRNAEQKASAMLGLIAKHMSDALDHGMQQHFEEIASLAALGPLREGRSRKDLRAVLDQIHRSFPEFAWIGLTDTQGKVLAGADGLLEGASVAARPWFAGAQDRPYVGDVHAALLLEKLLPRQAEPWRFVDIAAPVLDEDGRRVGVLGAHLSWEWARGVHANLFDRSLDGEGMEVLVVDRAGKVLIGPKHLEGLPVPSALRPSAVRAAAASSVGGPTVVEGIEYFTAAAQTTGLGRYPGLGWSVVVRQPAEFALADFRRLRDEILLVGALVSTVACIAAVYAARRLSSPLRRMSRALQDGDTIDFDAAGIGLYREAHHLALAFTGLFSRQRADAEALAAANASLEVRIAERTDTLQKAQALLHGIADNLPVLISYLDREGRVQFINATYLDWLGIDPLEAVGRSMRDLVGDERWLPRAPFMAQALTTGETVCFESSVDIKGRMRDLETTYVPHRADDGALVGLYALSTDVTALKEGRRAMEQLARVDALTGLPNRYHLNEQMPLALARGRRARTGVAVLFIDVDHFKRVNDTLGHAAGDAVLVEFADRLKEGVRTTDLVARLAGDEFVIVLEGVHDVGEAELVAAKLVAAIVKPMQWQGTPIKVGASIGIAFDAPCTSAPDALLSRADRALYEVKRSGRAGYRSSAPAPLLEQESMLAE